MSEVEQIARRLVEQVLPDLSETMKHETSQMLIKLVAEIEMNV